jgi:hypothetical protein
MFHNTLISLARMRTEHHVCSRDFICDARIFGGNAFTTIGPPSSVVSRGTYEANVTDKVDQVTLGTYF